MPEQPRAFRVAIIGAGPKALYALDSLARRLRADPPCGRVLRIEVLDPVAPPGTGAAYHLDQPSYLRLNVTASIVDVHEPHAPDRVFPGFRDWAAAQNEPAGGEDFPPRAVIGAYLSAAWEAVTASLPEGVQVCLRGERVLRARGPERTPAREGLAHPSGAWKLLTASGRERGPYDEVLVATGHAADHPGALHRHWASPTPLVPAVYPVQRTLTEAAVRAGARVAVRGAALTFIDAALALTEGRGGAFRARTDGSLEYLPGGREPAAIRPTARHGQFLDPKPDPGTDLAPDAGTAVTEARREIAAAADTAALTEVLERTAARIFAASADDDQLRAHEDVRAVLDSALGPETSQRGPAARVRLRRGIAAADGTEVGGPTWALGRAWSRLYTDIVARISFAPMPAEDWARFRCLAATCERWTFGPPLLNARKLLALLEAGVVDPSWLDAGVRIEPDGRILGPQGAAPAAPCAASWPDVVVDAVLAPPGAGAPEPLLGGLVADGRLTVPPGRRGCATTPEAAAVDAAGRVVPGLSVLGRPTEDVILGHDTLNRALHDQPQRWAQRLSTALRGEQ